MFQPKFLLLMAVLILAGCKKNDKPDYTGGKGGSGTIRVTPVYNGKAIDHFPVFIQWRDLSGDVARNYDDSAYSVQVSGKPVATFDSLKAGPYFVFSYGMDSTQNLAYFRGNHSVYLNEGQSLDVTLEMTQ